MRDVAAGQQRVNIALVLKRGARVGLDQRHQRIVDAAALGEAHWRDQQALVVDVGTVGSHAEPAEVDQVRCTRHQPDQPAPVEAWLHQHEVVQMTRAEPRIVGHEGIAGAHRRFRDYAEEMFYRLGHRVDVPGRAGDGLRQHVAVDVEYTGGNIAAFAHDRAEGGVHERLRLLVDHREQAVPHYLQLQR